MNTHSELWHDSQRISQFELIGGLIRSELEKEKVIRLDLSRHAL